VTCWLALTAVTAYLLDAIGLGVQPWIALAAGAALAGAIPFLIPRDSESRVADVIAWLGIVIFISAVLLRIAAPSFLPPGRGPDLTHHLLLVDYIEQNKHLVHDRSLSGAMGEMAHYTPAAHLLAVMAGKWVGRDGLHAFFPLVVVCAALTAGFVFLIARRISMSVPFAIGATALLFLPAQYFFGAFTHDGFLAQTVSTLFAVAMWWALTAWEEAPLTHVAALIAVFAIATFLSWPVWIGPPLLLFCALIAGRRDLATPTKQRQLGIVLVPLIAVFLIHSWDRWGWMVIVRTSGAILHPSLESLGWFLPLLALIGVMCGMSDRRARIAVVMLFFIALQGLTLFIIAKAQGADTPYMALKMVYLAIYPMAVLGALSIARLFGRTRVADSIGWVIAAALLVIAARPALAMPRSVPAVSDDLYLAGKWMRANVGSTCADYLVADPETAYWLHLAVLGNPRSSERTKELDHFVPRAAVAPWITSEGRDFAIADLRLLPDEVKSHVEVRHQSGTAAVIARPGAQRCTE
jgi:hypothetical protein